MYANNIHWSQVEQKVAQSAFEIAYKREVKALIEEVQIQANQINVIEDMWHLHDFLSARRHDIDGKYDYQYSVLIFVFARLVKEGWLQLSELDGLDSDKLGKVSALTRM